MQRPGRKCLFAFLAAGLLYLALTFLGVTLTQGTSTIEVRENREWVASGKFWLDRQMCNWLGVCGLFHYINKSGWKSNRISNWIPPPVRDSSGFWVSGDEDEDQWDEAERKSREIPQYVFDHAPYVHLYSGESFWPCDIAEHLVHTTPHVNYTAIEEMAEDRNLTNLNGLNDYEGGRNGRYIYLQSNDNVEERPRWLGGSKNIPSAPESPDSATAGPSPPDLSDLGDFDLEAAKQQALRNQAASNTEYPYPTLPTNRVPSTDGRCGGNTGSTCTGSRYGQCCSIYGYCGQSSAYCGADCDPLAGTCPDPLNPPRGPKSELRKRRRRRNSDSNRNFDNPSNDPTTNPAYTSAHHRPSPGGHSSAPALLITVPKADGVLDAFWFFFYSYNLGNRVFSIRFGNHVGDWEHTTIRFVNGTPSQIFLSEHNFGAAYDWNAVEKYIPAPESEGGWLSSRSNATAARHAKRPVLYSAEGSHALYATPGLHPYILPLGLLHDISDRGPLWDPYLNHISYTYNPATRSLKPSALNPQAPTGWFHYAGHWGDKFYTLADGRQYRFAGQYHYVNGPTGPKFKNLGRGLVCQKRGVCKIRDWIGGPDLDLDADLGGFLEQDGGEEGGLPGGNVTEEVGGGD